VVLNWRGIAWRQAVGVIGLVLEQPNMRAAHRANKETGCRDSGGVSGGEAIPIELTLAGLAGLARGRRLAARFL
jgi:hypothetical protein